ncbi:MAG: PEP-CTERM sorting domain-containing protein [Gammaproteobacteria bacterium]|nr:PEP-CTERM sorting domain-containing protein [Gammaproteobacteria bacterium]
MDLIGTGFGSGSLDGGGIDFTFDPGVLQVVGVVLSPDWEFPVPPATIDNVAGTVTGINFASFADRTGDLTFATVTFDANGPGSSALLLSENASSPFFTGGVAYPDLVFSTQGSVEVTASAVPLPGTLGLLATAAGFVLLRRHRRR